jgi:hypothetical protein
LKTGDKYPRLYFFVIDTPQGKFEHFFLMNIFTQSIKQGCEYFVQINRLAYLARDDEN